MFYNSGNYGLALAELAYPGRPRRRRQRRRPQRPRRRLRVPRSEATNAQHPPRKDGGAVQAFVVLSQNVLTFTVGLAIAASAGSTGVADIAAKILRLPVLYTFAAALLARWWLGSSPSHTMPLIVGKTADFLSAGLVPVALVTLGCSWRPTRAGRAGNRCRWRWRCA
jgi:hypothetical protein